MLFLPNLELTDLNGERWPLSAPGCPVRLRTVTGLEGAEWDFDTTTGVGQPGVTVVARTDKESFVEMTLWVGPVDRGDPAVELLRDFLDGLGRGWSRDGRLMTLTALDTDRFQQVRLAEKYKSPDWAQMFHVGRTELSIKLQSDESWWRAKPVDKTFTPGEFATASVTNRGNVEEGAWPWFRIDGPIANPTIGLVDEQVTIPLTLAAGQWVEVNTDPDWWEVRDQAGIDRTWSVGERWHQTAPPDTANIKVNISGTGTTTATRVRVVVPQLFHGAM